MVLTIIYDQEGDGRYIAEIPELPEILPAYGNSRDEARKNVIALALFLLADRIEEGLLLAPPETLEFRAA